MNEPMAGENRRGRARTTWIFGGLVVVVAAIAGLMALRAAELPGIDAERVVRAAPGAAGARAPTAGAGAGLDELEGVGDSTGARGTATRGRVRLPGPGRLTGHVRDRADGSGVPGQIVELLPLPAIATDIAPEIAHFSGLGSDFGPRVRPIAETVSGRAGEFSFEGVREGYWYLDASSDRYTLDAPAKARVLASGDGGPVDVWVRRGGRVTGRVVDEDLEPVAGASVACGTGALGFLEAASNGDIALLRTKTDADGRFVFSAVPPAADYELAALGPGIAITHVTGIAVTVGEDTEVLVRGRPGASIHGRIVAAPSDSGDAVRPVEGALVGALPRGLRHLKLARELLAASHDVTDENGRYELRGVPVGAIDVLAMADDHLPGRGPTVRVTGPAPVTAPDFELERGLVVRGRVVDPKGAPITGARVLWNIIDIADVEGRPTMAPMFIAGMDEFEYPSTGPDGEFVAGPFANEPPHEIRVLRAGYAAGEASWSPADGQDLVIVLDRGVRLGGRVVDRSGEPVTDFSATISGRIESDATAPSAFNPFAKAQVFQHPRGEFAFEAVASGAQTLVVEADGFLEASIAVDVTSRSEVPTVVVTLDRGGRIEGVVVDEEGSPVAGAQVTTEGRIRRSFEQMESERKVIEDAFAVRGRRRQPTPPIGFLRYAAALGLMGNSTTSTAPDGTFTLDGLSAGSHEVLVFHRDFKVGAESAVVTPGAEPSSVTVTLSRGGGLRGVVRDRFGRPVSGGTVIAASPGLASSGSGQGELHQSRTDESGRYEMLEMEGGPYFLLTTRGDQELTVTSLLGSLGFSLVMVPEDRILEHDLVDSSAGACVVSGVVTRRGDPVSDGVLVAFALEAEGLLGLDIKVASAENDGTYLFDGLAPGEYRMTYETGGGRVPMLVDIPDAPEFELDLELPEGRIEGRLVDARIGDPVAGARVSLRSSGIDGGGLVASLLSGESNHRTTNTSADGSFQFQELSEDTYRLEVDRAARDVGAERVVYAPVLETVVDLGPREVIELGEIRLDPGVTLQGRVVAGDGAPVPDARVVAHFEGSGRVSGLRTASADANGGFEIHGLGPGPWTVSATADGFAASVAEEVAIDPDGRAPRTLEMTLERGSVVTAEVTDAGGVPMVGAACWLVREGERPTRGYEDAGAFFEGFFSGAATTDGEGRLELGRYSGGAYELRATIGARSAVRKVTIETTPSGAQLVRITLP